MIKKMVMGAGAAGVAALGYLGISQNDDEGPAEQTPPAEMTQARAAPGAVPPGEICLHRDIRFLAGDQSGCHSKEDLAVWAAAPLVDPSRGAMSVKLTHPRDASRMPVDSTSCREFNEMRYEGWYAMTSRDMRREAFFVRACGAIAMLRRASPAGENHFDAAGLMAGDIATLGASAALRLVGGSVDTPADPEIEAIAEGAWRMSAAGSTLFIDEIATMDFDDDNVAEKLVFMASGPDEGTASLSEIVLIGRDSAQAELSVTPIDFTAKPVADGRALEGN